MKNFRPTITNYFSKGFGALACCLAVLTPSAHAEETLKLEDFLKQVVQQNTGVQGSSLAAKASLDQSVGADLITLPNFYASIENKNDAKIGPFPFLNFDRLVTNVASLGISQNFSFGLQAKLHYDLISVNYLNPSSRDPNSAQGAAFIPIFQKPYNLAATILELSQSIWGNGFGRSTRASQDLAEAQSLASSHASEFQTQSALVQAELAYWRLAAARQVIEVQKQAIDRATKIYEWNKNRVNLHLGDEADELQAKALVESRGLDVLTAQNEERSAARAFNSARNIESDEVKEVLHRLDPEDLSQIEIPKRAQFRQDVLAAQQTARLTEANAVIQTEKTRPNLDIYGSVALNGQPLNMFLDPYGGATTPAQTLGLSVLPNRPTYVLGLRFSMPLAFGKVSQVHDGLLQEKVAAQLTYERKLFDQEQNWKELVQNLADSQQHLKLSQSLESTQKSKLEKEKERLSKGRSTTYQVLLFEQDYLFSQLGRVKDQIALLNILAQNGTSLENANEPSRRFD